MGLLSPQERAPGDSVGAQLADAGTARRTAHRQAVDLLLTGAHHAASQNWPIDKTSWSGWMHSTDSSPPGQGLVA
ncbi:hypothetical protein BJY16_001754 [Actinoplanes octamycinicus]|uniref:Uncharacterized protein n=1 Tax=Actinoplanes octamycinicus TaxID=135948 RepID=A0A7W7GU15_9ACTN|nr:hypothetical protein [Actinoplanes octamycinicus]MBB4738295.1 hypothetical protein [Actinoplanes octamycinicus]